MNIDETMDRTLLTLKGPIRLGETQTWLELAQRAWERRLPIDVDFSEAEHMHAAAWQVLFALRRNCSAAAVPFRIRAASQAASAGCKLLGFESELSGGGNS